MAGSGKARRTVCSFRKSAITPARYPYIIYEPSPVIQALIILVLGIEANCLCLSNFSKDDIFPFFTIILHNIKEPGWALCAQL